MTQPETVEQRRQGPRLSEALEATFDLRLAEGDYAQRAVQLAVSLTNSPAAYVVSEGQLLAASGPSKAPSAIYEIASLPQSDEGEGTVVRGGYISTRIGLPGGDWATLVVQAPAGGSVVGALALERLTLLAAISSATFKNEGLDRLTNALDAIARDDINLQSIADSAALATQSDYAAIARLNGGSVTDLAISGQSSRHARASLPAKLQEEFERAAKTGLSNKFESIAHGPAGSFIVRLEQPDWNSDLAKVISRTLASGSNSALGLRNTGRRKLLRSLAIAAGILGLAFLPLPDGTKIPSEVTAVNERVITAPFTSTIEALSVRENDRVFAGKTELFRLDAAEMTLELIEVQSEHAQALLIRETARSGRDATALKNAELEVERLRSRIDLLENRIQSATIVAPIDGLTAGDGFGDLLGATVRQGDPVLRVLDPGDIRLSLEIADQDLATIPDGAEGLFRPDFNPNLAIASKITSVSPALSDRADIAVFSGRASLSGDVSALSPGLRGVLVIDQEWRPTWRIVWDSLRDWVLLKVWL